MFKFNPLYYKKERCMKISLDFSLLLLYYRFYSEVLCERSCSMNEAAHLQKFYHKWLIHVLIWCFSLNFSLLKTTRAFSTLVVFFKLFLYFKK